MFLAQLKSIAAVAEAGSITKAAKILFGSQPNISRYIQLFEENYNMQLFHREKHGMSLTAEGNCVMPYIYSILECVNALDEFCKNALHEEIYYLRVVTQQFSFQVHQLSKLITALQR